MHRLIDEWLHEWMAAIELNKSGFTAAYFRQPLGRPNVTFGWRQELIHGWMHELMGAWMAEWMDGWQHGWVD